MSIMKKAQDLILKLQTENQKLRTENTSYKKQAADQGRTDSVRKVASQFHLDSEGSEGLSDMSQEHLDVLANFGTELVGDKSFAGMESQKTASSGDDYEIGRASCRERV